MTITEPTRRSRRRSGTGALLWTAVAGGAVWAAVRLSGLEPGAPVTQLVAFTPYVAAAALLPAVAAALLRRWPAAVAALVVAVALGAAVLPRAVGAADDRPGGRSLRVLGANLLFGTADAGAVVALVRAERIDVLALQEYTDEAGRALAAAGLGTLLPYAERHPEPGAGGSALYSRFPLSGGGLRRHPEGFGQAYATVAVPGGAPVAVESVHPCAPSDFDRDHCWAAGLAGQPRADGSPRVLVGDFNATLDHATLRRLLATGYVDAADAVGAGFVPTWPYDGDPIPPVTIDHVLVDRAIGVRRFAVHPVRGSDHRAVLAELRLP